MKTPKLLDTLDRDQALQELNGAWHSRENVRLHERYQVVNMVVQGHSYEVISQLVKPSMTTIGRYVEAYHQEGLGGLAMSRPRFRQSICLAIASIGLWRRNERCSGR
jgi:uncharacterized protein YerC